MRPDFEASVARIRQSEACLSRSRSGVSDTSASPSKRPLVLAGDDLIAQVQRNTEALYLLLGEYQSAAAPDSANQVRDQLRRIESTINDGLLPGGRYRTWEVTYAKATDQFSCVIPAAQIPQSMEAFVAELYRRWGGLPERAVETAAWAEWTLQGPLHPYYDGCGRISRAVCNWLLLWSGHQVPLYTSRAEWFEMAFAGLSSFTDYLRRCASA